MGFVAGVFIGFIAAVLLPVLYVVFADFNEDDLMQDVWTAGYKSGWEDGTGEEYRDA